MLTCRKSAQLSSSLWKSGIWIVIEIVALIILFQFYSWCIMRRILHTIYGQNNNITTWHFFTRSHVANGILIGIPNQKKELFQVSNFFFGEGKIKNYYFFSLAGGTTLTFLQLLFLFFFYFAFFTKFAKKYSHKPTSNQLNRYDLQ
jgi:hypothetical protein